MAGIWIDFSRRPRGHAPARTHAPAHGPASGPCLAIMTVAEDFQDLIRAECPRCSGGTGDCLVGQLRAAVREAAPD